MLLSKDICLVGNEILREKCSDVEIPMSEKDIKTLKEMREYLYNGYDEDFVKKYDIRPGVGLAAPQIGKALKMLCILAIDENGDLHDYAIVNPKIISHSVELTYLETGEGCLSVPDDYKGYIHRYKRVKVKTYLYDFEKNELTSQVLSLKGYLSIVFQHEFDHLNGVLFFDHINKADPFFVPENSTPVVFKKEDEE